MSKLLKFAETSDRNIDNIYNAVTLDEKLTSDPKFKENNENFIKDQISKKVLFNEEGNPIAIDESRPGVREKENAVQDEKDFKLFKKAAENTKEFKDFKKNLTKKLNDKIEKKIEKTIISKVLKASGKAIIKTVGKIFDPVTMGDQLTSLQIKQLENAQKQENLLNHVNNAINIAAEKLFGEQKQNNVIINDKYQVRRDNTYVTQKKIIR